MKVLALLAVLLSFFINMIHAAPLHTPLRHDTPAIIKDFEQVGARVAELDKAIKSFGPKTDVGTIRNLTSNVEMAIVHTHNDVDWNKSFNEKDSKAMASSAD
ncbi:hypothetical protein P170DRAFT_460370 [Aspergillus steynii IBT 23096]|uniref:Uncharacterized protein n=1 Tax=Aspergillus steynii IBT 23096 TaxID=1392250 RepID=A0A2I2GMT2_9EURO|nr:uncharacterized protein P170DRAFT_460370 [Aspergillus steynii IBT 23096]PLB54149.1 hypothetical protein P170DRAFT_460370 [Aspergillus steynii IBT 23096]